MARASERSLGYRMPDGIEPRWIDDRNGYLTGKGCPHSRMLPFITGSEPRQRTNCSPRKSGIVDWFQSLFGRDG
jgi:penicillin-binding protein 1B